ncbi:MAG: glycosyltransferase family 39 protein [Elusimicrobiota bacterium]|nr:glycosyltransferase family 39 protein [Endomicrobiia bacterium]MDW8166634.1 glycosyltransferase family 39 protein [Elusimicrobiota bacterium]
MNNLRQKIFLAILLLACFFTRYISSIKGFELIRNKKEIPGRDVAHYVSIAKNLMDKKIYAIDEYPTAIRPPAYPYFLWLNFKFFGNESYNIIIYEQIFLTCLTVMLLFFIGKNFSFECGLFAAFIYVIWYPTWERVSWISTEVFTTFFVVLSLFLFLGWNKNKNGLILFLSGVAIGIASLARGEVVVIPFVILINFLIKRHFQSLLYFLIGVAILLLPWLTRNYLVYKKLIFSTSTSLLLFCDQGAHRIEQINSSAMLFGIKNEEIKSFSSPFDIAFTTKEVYYSELFMREKVRYVLENPLKGFKVLLKNFLIMWYPMGPPVWAGRYDPFFGLLIFFMFIVLIKYHKISSYDKTIIGLLNLFWLPLLFSYTIFVGDPIYRLTYEPILCVLGSYGFTDLLRQKSMKKYIIVVGILVINILLHFVYYGEIREKCSAFIAKIIGLRN